MSNNVTAITRLTNDFKAILSDPIPGIEAKPVESNVFEWHYVIFGSKGTPYEGGYYHGKLIFPFDFPFKPPKIFMITPSGRFKTNFELCLSISSHHPESWNPAWTVLTILLGILSFMNGSDRTYGDVVSSDEKKRKYAKRSKVFNLKNEEFCQNFPQLVAKLKREIKEERKMYVGGNKTNEDLMEQLELSDSSSESDLSDAQEDQETPQDM